ncbi:low affinity immunoglobulin gamma Fc region receptor II-a-like isoform X3 [Acanthopagrus latus]|uniref:low affinity immunoglobulin gamma Fc region receptor II-a-like isoform X3 n=1 Tax=Acanthopagrus latus TaxID=8177 RepID=UPI00187C2582|nr:low affinity immunoglobulin gamma Fc region receptor II-a-like isoform X3 [Acanthopagrus latus]
MRRPTRVAVRTFFSFVSPVMNVLFLLSALDHTADSLFLRVDPNREQFFRYDPVALHCDASSGSVQWKFVHKSEVEKPNCKLTDGATSTGSSCSFKNVYPEEGGEYWCEDGEGKRSNNITFTVTNGSVILDSPALPVMEGAAVTLRCRSKTTSSNLTAGFYKDGRLIRSNSTGEMIIHSVSRSDEGQYKCNISGVGESSESLLAVIAKKHKEEHSSSSTPWIIVTVVLLVLLMVVGLRHLGTSPWSRAVWLYLSTLSPGSGSTEDQTEYRPAEAAKETYATVRKKKKKDEDEMSKPVYYILGVDENEQLAEADPPGASCSTVNYTVHNPPEDAFYSTIQLVD